MNAVPGSVVSRDPVCPVCGQLNGCALARTGSFAEPCWCAEVEISADAIAKIPEEMRGKSCICHNCASTTRLGKSNGEL